jgi:hypothetical protein
VFCHKRCLVIVLDHLTSLLYSEMDAHAIEEMRSTGDKDSKFLSHLDQIKVPGLHPSMSMSDLVSRISEQLAYDRPIFSGNRQCRMDILEEVTQYLFSDSQLTSASDEQSLMARVNSLCCLLQKDPSSSQNLQAIRDDDVDVNGDQNIGEAFAAAAHESNPAEGFSAPGGESNEGSGFKQAPAMSRKDSLADLLLNLPRIASLPHFWFSLPEDSHNRSR